MEVTVTDGMRKVHKLIEEVKRGDDSTPMICGVCKRVISDTQFVRETISVVDTIMGADVIRRPDEHNPFGDETDMPLQEVEYYHSGCAFHYMITQRGILQTNALSITALIEMGIFS